MIVARLITYYILWALRFGLPPWYFFQLNAKYFNAEKGIYSKLDIDKLIPEKWRISQKYLDINNPPQVYPVFLKPEWGQNGYGIKLIHTQEAYKNACKTLAAHKVPYIVQALASGKIEYELFYIQDPSDTNNCISFTVTEVMNSVDDYPINAIQNKNTEYKDRTADFNNEELQTLKTHMRLLPCFRIARIALKTESKKTLISGNFKIIEVNLFAPMPLNLLDSKHNKQHKNDYIKVNMKHLAKLSGTIPKEDFKPFIFFKKVLRHFQVK